MAKDAVASSGKAPKSGKTKLGFSKRITRYFKDLCGEVKKVVWPDKAQVKNNTIVVLVFCVLAAVFVSVADFILSILVQLMVEHQISWLS